MKFNLNKPITTVDGRKVDIICKGLKDEKYTIAAIITDFDGRERINTYTKDGEFVKGNKGVSDLINYVEKTTKWLNINKDGAHYDYDNKKLANENAGHNRIACIKIEYIEGEGLKK